MVKIELSDKEAEIFIANREAKIPEIFKEKGGKAIYNFAKGGTLINILLNDFEVYRRVKYRKGLDKHS